ncbi:DotU family type IV/VI secretion system protein [Pseudomonas saxonica]|uniref:DotU family type IV/VI secretion system protein n=1 Tax=Pseudomonas saxonica TaxID=2600598 RepID=A0ABY3GNT3_9PSED|nr:type IVB secretion system protein IcmH/DotU [Pseudomonas saxonica]TWR93294.1 DotU family type IV/VI secretion system protein [Pseudomonas saxonica]
MSKDTPMEDEKTVLAAKHRPGADTLAKQPAMIDGPVLTDQSPPPTIEKLEDRMIFSARLQAAGTFNVSLNPLVAAASGLLSCVVGLKHSEVAPGIPELREQLINDLNAFVQEALYNGVDYDLAMKARYVMSTVLDETVVTTPWGYESEWSQHTLLSSLHNETFGGEKVFHVLEQLCRNPVVNLSLLELIYLCLSLGFQGKYRVVNHGTSELDSIRDALYRQIRHLRGDVPRELSPHWQGLTDRRHRFIRSVPGWVLGTLTVGCLLVMFSGFAWVLGEQREAVLRPYEQLESSVVQQQS